MQDSKINVKNYINANINTNGINSITGFMHNKALIDFLDSIIWYNERRNEYIFPKHIKAIYTSFQSSLTVGTYGIVNFDPTNIPSVTALQDDIFIVSSGPIWNAAPEWDRDKDWILYNEDDEKLYIYDHRKDVGSRWTEIGIPFHINHNQLNTLQGGDSLLGEYYHMTQGQHDALLDMMIKDIVGVDYRVKQILADTSDTSYITGFGKYFLIGTNGQYDLYESSGVPGSFNYYPVTISPKRTYLVLNEDDQKIYAYSEHLDKWLNLGDFIKFDHENLDNLQGGIAGEHNHLTNSELAKLLSLYNYYLVNVQHIVKNVLPDTTDISYINANGQYFLIGSGPTYSLYTSTGYPSNPQYHAGIPISSDVKVKILYAEDTKKQYFYSAEHGAYIDAGKFIAFEHNAGQGIQGGSPGEYFHLTASEWASVIDLQYTQTLYVDSTHGNDSTGDGSTSTPYKTLYGALLNSKGVNMIFVLMDGTNKYYIDDDFVEELQKRKIISLTFSNYADTDTGEDINIVSATGPKGCYVATFSSSPMVEEYYIKDNGNKYILKSYENVYDTSGHNTNTLLIQKGALSGDYDIYAIDKQIEFTTSSDHIFSKVYVLFDNIKVTRNSVDIFSCLRNTNTVFRNSCIGNISSGEYFPLSCYFDDCVYDDRALKIMNVVSFSSLYIKCYLGIETSTFHGSSLAIEGGQIAGANSNSRLYVHGSLLLLLGANIDISNPLKIYSSGETYLSQNGSYDTIIFDGSGSMIKDIDIVFDNAPIVSNDKKFYFDNVDKSSFPYSSNENINVIFPKDSNLNFFKQEVDFNYAIESGDSIDINLFNKTIVKNCELALNLQQDNNSIIEKDLVLLDGTSVVTSNIGTLSSATAPDATITYNYTGHIATVSITCNSGNTLYISGKIKHYGILNHSEYILNNIY